MNTAPDATTPAWARLPMLRWALSVGILGGLLAAASVAPVPPATPLLAYGLCVACGLLAGFLSGLLGIGGGLVVVPALYLLLPALGIPLERVPHVAVASALFVMLPSTLVATGSQRRHKMLDRGWIGRLVPGMVLGAVTGALAAQQLRGPVLTIFFVVQSLYYGWCLMHPGPPAAGSPRARVADLGNALPPACGGPLIAGLSACAGMGCGSLLTPYLAGRGLALRRASATAGALNLCIALGGGLVFALSAAAEAAPCWPAVLLIALPAMCMAPRGVALAHRLPLAVFRRVLGAVNVLGALALVARMW